VKGFAFAVEGGKSTTSEQLQAIQKTASLEAGQHLQKVAAIQQ
jgi:hypothetical protein